MAGEQYVIHVTHQCNMKCLYCYENDKTSSYTWNEVRNFIDNLIQYRTSDDFSIEFLGGEPVLAWDLIQKSYEYIESKYCRVVNVNNYTITTNGTIINEHILNYLKNNHKMHYAISLDGHKWANQLRIMKGSNNNSYDTVMETVRLLQENDLNVGVHIVVHPFNIGFLEDSIIHLYEKGIRSIGVGTIESTMKIDQAFADSFVKRLNNISLKVISGELKDLGIDLFGWVKPKEDVRSYIKDENGKIIGESYGRSGDDVSKKDELYKIERHDEETEISNRIFNMRREVYLNHRKNLMINQMRERSETSGTTK